jgi:hypothetical protein
MTTFIAGHWRGSLEEELIAIRVVREVLKYLAHEVFLNVCLGSRADGLWHHVRDSITMARRTNGLCACRLAAFDRTPAGGALLARWSPVNLFRYIVIV